MIFWVVNQVHSYLQLPGLCFLLILCFLSFSVKQWEPQVAWNKWLVNCEENLSERERGREIDSQLQQVVKRKWKEERKEAVSHDSRVQMTPGRLAFLSVNEIACSFKEMRNQWILEHFKKIALNGKGFYFTYCRVPGLLWYWQKHSWIADGFIELSRLEKTFKICQSNHQPSTTTVTPDPLNHITSTRSRHLLNPSRDAVSTNNRTGYTLVINGKVAIAF